MIIAPDFEKFAAAYDAGRAQLVATELVGDLETPVSVYLKVAEGRGLGFLLESVEGGETRARYSAIGLKPDVVWRCRGDVAEINRDARWDAAAFVRCDGGALESLRALIAESRIDAPHALPGIACGLYGYLAYDMVRLVERLPAAKPDPIGLPDAMLIRPTVVVVFDGVKDTMTVASPVWPQPGVNARAAYARAGERIADVVGDLDRALARPGGGGGATGGFGTVENGGVGDISSNTTVDEYHAMVAQAKEYIRAGDAFQIVPSQRFSRTFPLPPFALYRALRRTNPSPYMFHLDLGDFAIVGASPEVLVGVKGGAVTIRPIAGTRPRGADPDADLALEVELLADPKERAEHLMLLDLGRNDVGRVAKLRSVRVTEQFVVERYSHVMHIVSNVVGDLRDDVDALAALLAGLPAGTVSGAPKVRAMEIINELEKEKRGVYAGGVGYFAANGDMDLCIALRTAVVKDGVMYVQAGGGVVADSDPAAEYEETVNKSKALMRAAEAAARFASGVGRGQ